MDASRCERINSSRPNLSLATSSLFATSWLFRLDCLRRFLLRSQNTKWRFLIDSAMLRRGLCFLYAVLIFASSVNGVIYHPASCKQRCTGNEFIQRLPIEDGPIDGAHNRAYVWAIIGLIQQRLAFGAKLAAPPGSGRIVGIIGSCLHAGSTVAQKSEIIQDGDLLRNAS